jgi:hypothetical protein
MQLSLRDDLELLLREFGVTTEQELLQKKTSTTDKLIRAMPLVEAPKRVQLTTDQVKKLCEQSGLRYQTGYENRVIERITTTEIPDRYGDVVRAKGIDNTNYRKNAVVLFAHNHGDFPVGKSIKEWIDKGIKGWRSYDLYFDDTVDPSGKSDLTFRMVDSGAMPGGSIGFIPGQSKTDHTPEERDAMGLGRYGVEYLTAEKLEHSACSVPANPEALANCLKSIDQKRFKALFSLSEIDRMSAAKMLDEELLDIFASILEVKRVVSIPAIPIIIPKSESIVEKVIEAQPLLPPVTNIVVNVDLSKAVEQIEYLTNNIKVVGENLKALTESCETKVSDLMAATQRALTALEQKSKSSGFYDRKEIENILRVPK